MPDIKEKAENLGHAAREQAGKFGEKAKDVASGVVGQVKETFHDVTSNAADMASKAAGQVRDTAKEWMGVAEDAAMKTARTVKGAAGDAADKVADISDDVTQLIRRNPIPAVLCALGIGFLAAVALRRSST